MLHTCNLQLPSLLDATVCAIVTAGKHLSLVLVDKQSGNVLMLLAIRPVQIADSSAPGSTVERCQAPASVPALAQPCPAWGTGLQGHRAQ